MENFSSVTTTLFSNLILGSLCFTYLFFRKPLQHIGAFYLPHSVSYALNLTYSATDSEIITSGGQDAFLYLSLLKSLIYLLLFYSFLGLFGLIPIYKGKSLPTSSSLSRFSIETMNSEDFDLLIPAICTLIFSAGIYFSTFLYFRMPNLYPDYIPKVIITQWEDFKEEYRRKCTIQITNIPLSISPDYLQVVIREKLELYSFGNIISVNVVPDLLDIEKDIQEKVWLDNKIKYGDHDFCAKNKEFYIEKKKIVAHKIKVFKSKYFEKNAGFAFVVCKQPMIADYIMSVFEAEEEMGVGMNQWKLVQAPHFDDIIWKNPPISQVFSVFQQVFWNFLFILVFFIVLTPLELAGVASEALQGLNLSSKTSAFITLSLPSFAMSIFHSIIIPMSIRFLTEQEKNHLYSQSFSSSFTKYMLYSIVIMILFPLLGAITLDSFIEKLSEVKISEWNVTFVSNIVLVGEFFVSFLISMAIGSNILDLILRNEYFTTNFYVYRKSFTEKNAPVFDFAYEYSRVLCVLFVILVFSVSMPLILPFGCMYMSVKYWFDKYNLLFVYRTESLPGNRLQGIVIVFILIILGISQIINSGLFMASGIRGLVWFGGVLTVLAIFTLITAALVSRYWENFRETRHFEINEKESYTHPYLDLLDEDSAL